MRRIARWSLPVLAALGVAWWLVRPAWEIPLGEMRIALGSAERLVVMRWEGEPGAFVPKKGVEQALVHGGEIPFQYPMVARNWIDPKALYCVSVLPFEVRLKGMKRVAAGVPHSRIEAGRGPEQIIREVREGDVISLGSERLEVAAIRRWSGVLYEPEGQPVMAVSVEKEGVQDGPVLLFGPGAWEQVWQGLVVRWAWLGTRGEVEASSSRERLSSAAPRWGVVDGERTSWFSSFLPGSGAILSDGREVTVQRFVESEGGAPARLVLSVEQDGMTEFVEVTAGQEGVGPFRLDAPGLPERCVVFYAWRDGAAMGAAYEKGERFSGKEMEAGEEWKVDGWPFTLRLDGVVESGIRVELADSPYDEVVLASDKGHVVVREGETMEYDGWTVRFCHEHGQLIVKYELATVEEGNETPFSLGTGGRFQAGGWVFSPGETDERGGDVVWLRVARGERVPAVWVGIGVGLWGLLSGWEWVRWYRGRLAGKG